MTAIICTIISALVGGLLVARFSKQTVPTIPDSEELRSQIAKIERQVHRLREISSRSASGVSELSVRPPAGRIATSSSNVRT